MIPKSRESRRDSKQTNHAMDKIMQETDQVLKKMDAAILILQYSTPAFYEHFRNSRKIVDMGSRSQAIRGLIQDAVTREGIHGVMVSFEAGNGIGNGKSETGTPLKQKKTAAKGGFTVPRLDTGTYLVTAGKEGYESRSMTIIVTDGELTHVNLELKPM